MEVSRRLTSATLAFLCLASALTIVVLGTRLTFFNDDWYILLLRPGWSAGALLEPHNGHLSLLPVVAYKSLVSLFGLDAQLPFRLVIAALTVALALVVFAFVRERAGVVLALTSAALLLFLGPAWQDLLWFSTTTSLVGSLASGVGALLALERGSRRGDLLACLLLVVSLGFSNLGVPFVIAVAVAIMIRRRLADAWVAAIPAVLFAAWWLAYGRGHQTGFSFANLSRVPFYVLDAMSSGLASLAGLSVNVEGQLDPYPWGRVLLAIAAVATIVWLLRGNRPSPGALPIATAGISFWVLTGASFIPNWREPEASEYQLISATFLILFAAEFFRPVRLSPPVLVGVVAVSLVCLGANLGALKRGYEFFRDESEITRADLGALDVGGRRIPAKFRLLQPIAGSIYLTGVYAGPYLRERDAHGSPALTPAEIARASPEAREAADVVLASGYGLHLEPGKAPSSRRLRRCRRLASGFDGALPAVDLPRGGALIANLGSTAAHLRLRRFSRPGFPGDLGGLAPMAAARLEIPTDGVRRPWRLAVDGASPMAVCPLLSPG